MLHLFEFSIGSKWWKVQLEIKDIKKRKFQALHSAYSCEISFSWILSSLINYVTDISLFFCTYLNQCDVVDNESIHHYICSYDQKSGFFPLDSDFCKWMNVQFANEWNCCRYIKLLTYFIKKPFIHSLTW